MLYAFIAYSTLWLLSLLALYLESLAEQGQAMPIAALLFWVDLAAGGLVWVILGIVTWIRWRD